MRKKGIVRQCEKWEKEVNFVWTPFTAVPYATFYIAMLILILYVFFIVCGIDACFICISG